MAKNCIQRSLWNVIDPSPTKARKNEIWKNFGNKCAFCGISLNRIERKGHVDHLFALNSSLTICRSIFVLACAECNGNEKRDKDWQQFLTDKCESPEIHATRLKAIEDWFQKTRKGSHPYPVELIKAITIAERQIVELYESKCIELRKLRQSLM